MMISTSASVEANPCWQKLAKRMLVRTYWVDELVILYQKSIAKPKLLKI